MLQKGVYCLCGPCRILPAHIVWPRTMTVEFPTRLLDPWNGRQLTLSNLRVPTPFLFVFLPGTMKKPLI